MCEHCEVTGVQGWSDVRDTARVSRRGFLALAALALGSGAGDLTGGARPAAAAAGTGVPAATDVPTLGDKSALVAPGLRVRRRADWAGRLRPRGALHAEPDVRFLLVHHTAGSFGYSRAEVPSVIRSVCLYQMSAKGWPDTCYNFFVDKYGGVWEGRKGSLAGPVMADATGGSQGFAQLVCLLGNFEVDVPTSAMIDSLSRLLGWLAHRHDIDLSQRSRVSFVSRGSNRWSRGTNVTARPISGHRDMSYTACPGRNVYPLLARKVPARARAFRATLSHTDQ